MTLSRRIAALLFGLWFVLLVGEPQWLSPCPTHGVPGASHGAGAPHDADAPDADGESLHQASHHPSHQASHQAPAHGDGQSGHDCSCPGPSCGPGAIAPTAAQTSPFAAVLAHHAVLTVAALEHHPVAAAHSLPFANGPPRATRA